MQQAIYKYVKACKFEDRQYACKLVNVELKNLYKTCEETKLKN